MLGNMTIKDKVRVFLEHNGKFRCPDNWTAALDGLRRSEAKNQRSPPPYKTIEARCLRSSSGTSYPLSFHAPQFKNLGWLNNAAERG